MKAKRLLKILLLPILLTGIIIALASCGERPWENASFTWLGEDIIAWSSDEGVEKYQVYVDGELFSETADEYCMLDEEAGEHTVRVVKVKGGRSYTGEEMEYIKPSHNVKNILSFSELESNHLMGNEYQLGSLKYDSVFLFLNGAVDMGNRPIVIASSLNSLRISGGTVTGFVMKIEERTAPLTLIFDDISISSSSANTVYTSSATAFDTAVIMLGSCSFSNSYRGSDGADGAWGGGVQAENGVPGGNGGSIFSLPAVKLFTEKQPTFSTGNGGNGGDGGSATNAFTHGGYGAPGGSGGYAFRTSSLVCFNARYSEYGGSFGTGGKGGAGGYGNFSGTRPSGANGAAGAFCSSAPTYLSRKDGVIPQIGGTGDDTQGFPLSYVNGYLVWTEQPGATSYEVLMNGSSVARVNQNVYYAETLSELGSSQVKIKANYSDSEAHLFEYSEPLKIYSEDKATELSQIGSSLSGSSHIIIDEGALNGITNLTVGSDVKRLTLKGTGGAFNYLSISASGRSDNLIIDLYSINIVSPHGSYATISLNDGNGTSDGSCPMLIVNLYNSTVCGCTGSFGSKGTNAGGFLEFGGNGGNGGTGGDGIKAYYTVIMGESGAILGGYGGNGGEGGSAATNNGGDGGNGGTGGVGINSNCFYILLNEETSYVRVSGGEGGEGGERGDGFGNLLNSARPGSDGSAGRDYSGTCKKYVGSLAED